MSRTQFVRKSNRPTDEGFWAVDDALQVWLAYVVEEIDRRGLSDGSWLEESASQWRVSSAVNDFGATLPDLGGDDLVVLLDILATARLTAEQGGDLSEQALTRWLILDDLPVAGAFSRTGGLVEVARVLEVADGFAHLLDDSLPDAPEGTWWFFGAWGGDPPRTIEMKSSRAPGAG